MKKTHVTILILIAVVALTGIIYAVKKDDDISSVTPRDPKNISYIIDGQEITLKDGKSETEAAPGSASKINTEYSGNEFVSDLDKDGRDDTVFLLTQNTGGSGTFFYVVAALNQESGYVGSQALLLGDRIAPQSIEKGTGNIIIVNYVERRQDESFDVQPSVGKSILLILDPKTMQFGEAEQNFEGEADPNSMHLNMQTWNWISTTYNDGRVITPLTEKTFTVTFDTSTTFSSKTDCNNISGMYKAEGNQITFDKMMSTKMFCAESQEADFSKALSEVNGYHFTSKGELVFDSKNIPRQFTAGTS